MKVKNNLKELKSQNSKLKTELDDLKVKTG